MHKTNSHKLLLAIGLSAVALTLSVSPLLYVQSAGIRYFPTAQSAYSGSSAGLSLAAAPVAEAAATSTGTSNTVYFKQTAHFVRDAFLNYWLMNGGVALYGYPISEEVQYAGKTVQYFERARFEYTAVSARPWHVDLTNAGSLLTQGRGFGAALPAGDTAYFGQTGHNLGGAFRQFWNAGGGVDVFGYPISEELRENGATVQYFERARFETAGQGRVQLGRVGAELLAKDEAAGLDPQTAAPLPRPGSNMSFRGEATWFHANWDRVISLNKGWGNLPDSYVGRGLYAAAPADLNLYGRWARVTRGSRSVFVQFVDVIDWKDIPYVRNKGIVIDLGEESYRALGGDTGGRYEVTFDVLWPDQEP